MAPRIGRGESGYVVVLLAVVMTVLLLITAMVIDNGFLRDDRRADQKVADAAASAAAVTLARTVDGRAACASAVNSLVHNLPEVSSIDGLDCNQIPVSCDDSIIGSKATTGTSGPYTITVAHPVADDDSLMATGSAIGAPSRPVTAGDGHKCDRVGVEVALERAPSFGAISSSAPRTTSVHTVALASTREAPNLPINLLILERYDCKAIQVDGNSGAQLIISPIIVDGVEHAGVLAVESDGTGPACKVSPLVGTLNVESAVVRADGPAGCANEIPDDPAFPTAVGEGCGDITLFAPGVPGPASPGRCQKGQYHPACTTNDQGSIRPHPQRMGARYTRAAIDHALNCKRDYTGESWYDESNYRIEPCFAAPSNNLDNNLDYVDKLRDFVGTSGTPPGFTTYTGPCIVTSPTVVPAGNVHVNCPTGLFVKDTLTFEGGNVIFDGDVVVEASKGHLSLHECGKDSVAVDGSRIAGNCSPTPSDQLVTDPAEAGSWARGDDFVETQYSSDAAWTVFRDGGGIRKAGGAAVTIHDSIMFLGENATVDSDPGFALQLAGSSNGGTLQWSATQEGPFENLALWSDSEGVHSWAGQASLDLEGVFFAPMAHIIYSGNGLQKQLAAQFITETLRVTGNGKLDIAPNIEREVPRFQARSTIIR